MKFFDAHTHLQFAAYDADRDEAVRRAMENDVWFVNVGTQRDTSKKAVDLTRKYETGVYATVGLHPIHTEKSYHDVEELGGGAAAKGFSSRSEEFDPDYYGELARDAKVVAIGECGLDYYRLSGETKSEQATAFVAQIELAHKLKKPLMIHCRAAFPDLTGILKSQSRILNQPPGIIHFFSGSINEVKILLDMGFYFTFGGVVTFTHDYDETIKMMPVERILSETDAPYVAPVPYRGKRNEPAYIVEVVKKLAELKNTSVDEIAVQILSNAKKVFLI